ncbi:MAG: ATP-dependent 6-phosphofructokinase [Anaerolineae bacterium]|nr:6-phosphofructokinase [Anaerolineales bacterium]MCQ3979387.1 6-phosphofructokinase [Anaerolineae bacterium]
MTTNKIKKIGILTSGGDAPGLNAVIRAVVITATRQYGWEVVGINDGFEGLLDETKLTPLSLEQVISILQLGGTILGTTNRGHFVFSEERPEELADPTIADQAVQFCKNQGIDALVAIGGDGTLRISHELEKRGLPIVSVPKTIDNDLLGTDYTFGFDTALTTATNAIDNLRTTAASHNRVMVVEVMGRDTGWIALYAGIGSGAHVILIPEIPFTVESILKQIEWRDNTLKAKFTLVVVAEGARPVGGEAIYRETQENGGMLRLGGIARWLVTELEGTCNHDVREVVLGHLQRGGSPTATDRVLCTRFGAEAVHLIAQGRTGTMVSLRGTSIEATEVWKVVARQKRVPHNGDLVQTARGLGICLGD